MPYILGARMRNLKEMATVLSRAGRYREVHPEGQGSKDPSPRINCRLGGRYHYCGAG
jgi:hypothetical protein